jgi:hypothetical protein
MMILVLSKLRIERKFLSLFIYINPTKSFLKIVFPVR